ncbi:serine hydrolase [Actinoplanes sp. NPDC051513]|uniref:serine hydrolase n=1 Tax=Actinoplanes sp. NPDC051513 TaxID=3363908 RepID=UPI003799AE31
MTSDSATIDDIVAATPHVRWSISVGGATHEPGRVLRTASVGKLLLLFETARRITAGELDPASPLARDSRYAVADSGLWQHLTTGALPVADVATLIAAVSDNYATNVLLERVGLASLATLADRLGLRHTALRDRVRDHRGPGHPATLSTGTAAELHSLMRRLARRELLDPGTDALIDGWLATSTDLSMVASAFRDDPLAHAHGVRNKTGTDDGVRADVGYRGDLSYAVLANWDPAAGDATAEVMDGMRAIGQWAMRSRPG